MIFKVRHFLFLSKIGLHHSSTSISYVVYYYFLFNAKYAILNVRC